jgi:sugar phosphate permease
MHWHRRYSILAILFSAYLLCYLDRMAIASAIPFIAEEFQLSPLAMGGVLSAFFFGYSLMQIPGGLLADKYGPNRVMTASIVCWSLFTALTGAAGSLTMLLVIRVMFGLSEGPFPPTASKTIALWFPRREVGRANGVQLAAVNIGAAIAPLLVVPLLIAWGWRAVFYSLLVPGLVLALVVRAFVKDTPVQPEHDDGNARIDVTKLRMTHVLKMPALFWCSVTSFFAGIAAWGLMNWLPTYLLQARGFSLTRMGFFAPLPFLAGAIGYYLGGHLSDKYFSHRRQIPIVFGLILGGGMTYLAAISPTGEWAVAALAPAFLFLFIASAGILTLPLVIVPQHAVGAAFGFVNTIGQLAAFLSPLLVGYVLTVTQSNFTLVFYCLVGLFVAAAGAALQIRQPLSVKKS